MTQQPQPTAMAQGQSVMPYSMTTAGALQSADAYGRARSQHINPYAAVGSAANMGQGMRPYTSSSAAGMSALPSTASMPSSMPNGVQALQTEVGRTATLGTPQPHNDANNTADGSIATDPPDQHQHSGTVAASGAAAAAPVGFGADELKPTGADVVPAKVEAPGMPTARESSQPVGADSNGLQHAAPQPQAVKSDADDAGNHSDTAELIEPTSPMVDEGPSHNLLID